MNSLIPTSSKNLEEAFEQQKQYKKERYTHSSWWTVLPCYSGNESLCVHEPPVVLQWHSASLEHSHLPAEEDIQWRSWWDNSLQQLQSQTVSSLFELESKNTVLLSVFSNVTGETGVPWEVPKRLQAVTVPMRAPSSPGPGVPVLIWRPVPPVTTPLHSPRQCNLQSQRSPSYSPYLGVHSYHSSSTLVCPFLFQFAIHYLLSSFLWWTVFLFLFLCPVYLFLYLSVQGGTFLLVPCLYLFLSSGQGGTALLVPCLWSVHLHPLVRVHCSSLSQWRDAIVSTLELLTSHFHTYSVCAHSNAGVAAVGLRSCLKV